MSALHRGRDDDRRRRVAEARPGSRAATSRSWTCGTAHRGSNSPRLSRGSTRAPRQVSAIVCLISAAGDPGAGGQADARASSGDRGVLDVQLDAVAVDHPGFLEPADAFGHGGRRHADPSTELREGDPRVLLQLDQDPPRPHRRVDPQIRKQQLPFCLETWLHQRHEPQVSIPTSARFRLTLSLRSWTASALIERYAAGTSGRPRRAPRHHRCRARRSANPEQWTAREVVHHLADSEMTSAIRLRRLLARTIPRSRTTTRRPSPNASTTPTARSSRPGRPLGRPPHDPRNPRAHDRKDWQRSGTHSESGPYSAETWLEHLRTHAHDHAAQIEACRGRSSPSS